MAFASNQDINARFEDWWLNPTEALDFEVKEWLDLSDKGACGTLAKAMIALETMAVGFC